MDGSERITIKRKKATYLTPAAYWVKKDVDYGEFVMTLLQKENFFILLGYRDELFLSLEQKIINNKKVHVEDPQTKTLASKGEQISKQGVINWRRTRRLDRKDHL